MQFIYLGETKVCKERMKELIKVAKNLEINQLINEVEVGKPENDSPEQGQRYCRKDTKEIKQKKGVCVWKSSNKPN